MLFLSSRRMSFSELLILDIGSFCLDQFSELSHQRSVLTEFHLVICVSMATFAYQWLDRNMYFSAH